MSDPTFAPPAHELAGRALAPPVVAPAISGGLGLALNDAAQLPDGVLYQVLNNGTLVGARRKLNLIAGMGVSLTITDTPASDRVDVTVTNTSTITTSSNQLAGDVTIVNANTFYDGPSLSLAAGTWLLISSVLVDSLGNNHKFTAKLWDGTTVAASGEEDAGATFAGQYHQIALTALVSPTGTTTYKVSVASTTGASAGKIKAAAVDNGAGNTASTLVAVKVA